MEKDPVKLGQKEYSHAVPGNIWNEKSMTSPRTFDMNRPWYFFARRLVEGTGLKGGRALDVGCGTGEFTTQLIELGFEVKGIDGESGQVTQVRQMGIEAQVFDLESSLPFKDNSFDLVTCLEVIEHIVSAERLLREIARILIPNGYLVLSTPNFSCWQNRLRYLRGKPPVNEGIHLRFFTPSTLEEAINTSSFEIMARSSFGPITGLNFLLRKLGKQTKHMIVPRKAEGLFAECLVLLARKKEE